MIDQVPWIQRKFNFDFPVGLFPVILYRLAGSLPRLQALLKNADEESCSHSTNGWSVKEHIGHLYDLEDLWWKRLQDFKENKPVLTAADMNNTKTKEAGHNGKTLDQLLGLFSSERQKILDLVYDFDETLLSRTSLHPRLNQPMRMVDSLFFVAEHDDNHISLIASLLRKPVLNG